MRRILVAVHRWAGLFTALFLTMAGLTGAVIAWDHELDALLNPELFVARSGSTEPRGGLALAEELERSEPRLLVSYAPLTAEAGHTLVLGVVPRLDPKTGQPFALDYSQVALAPASGAIQGRRLWGAPSLARENLLPFLYRLHYSLHLPPAMGLEPGVLLMGLVALVWALDALIALYISFPSLSAWRKSLAYRFRAGGYRLVFDLHRSTGVWTWALLLTLAVTGVSMNLREELMRPLVSLLSPLTPTPFDGGVPLGRHVEPRVDRAHAIATAEAEAARRGIRAPAGGIFYSAERGTYGVGFFEPGEEHGDFGLGNPWIYVDGGSGALAGAMIPGEGSAGDVFMHAQFPLHSGRILGLLGRALVSALGLVVALLSVTGVIVWARKRRARVGKRARAAGSGSTRLTPAPSPTEDPAR